MISGKTIDAIKTDIRSKTPVKHNGKLHVAYTKWNVNWRFWWFESPAASCSQLEQDANELAKAVISKYSRLEKEYDRLTNHGLNTGVILR